MPPLERLPRSPKAAPQKSQAASTKTSRCSPLPAPPPRRRQKFLPSARACRPLFKVLKGLSGPARPSPGPPAACPARHPPRRSGRVSPRAADRAPSRSYSRRLGAGPPPPPYLLLAVTGAVPSLPVGFLLLLLFLEGLRLDVFDFLQLFGRLSHGGSRRSVPASRARSLCDPPAATPSREEPAPSAAQSASRSPAAAKAAAPGDRVRGAEGEERPVRGYPSPGVAPPAAAGACSPAPRTGSGLAARPRRARAPPLLRRRRRGGREGGGSYCGAGRGGRTRGLAGGAGADRRGHPTRLGAGSCERQVPTVARPRGTGWGTEGGSPLGNWNKAGALSRSPSRATLRSRVPDAGGNASITGPGCGAWDLGAAAARTPLAPSRARGALRKGPRLLHENLICPCQTKRAFRSHIYQL